MTVTDVNSEEACQIAVSQAMKHMRPDRDPEALTVEETFASETTNSEAPQPAVLASVTARMSGGLGTLQDSVGERNVNVDSKIEGRKLKTTVKDPQSIERDKLNYLYGYYGNEQHIPGVCPCESCVQKQEELMAWALATAQEQHAQAVAAAVAASEEAQKTGTGPKPMMVTPYKHNWVIAGATAEESSASSEGLIDWTGILDDIQQLWRKREPSNGDHCCKISDPRANCLMM